MTSVDISTRAVMHNVTIRVRGLREMKMRTFLAVRVFRLGAWICGTQLEIEILGQRDER